MTEPQPNATPQPEVKPAEQKPTEPVWDAAQEAAVLGKYSNDTKALAKGYWESSREFQKRDAAWKAEQAKITEERSAWGAKQTTWEAEKSEYTKKIEASEQSTVTAAAFTNDVFRRVQLDLVNEGKVSDELKKDLATAGIQGVEQDHYVEAVQRLTETKFTAAQACAPQGTDVKELLKFMNSDAAEPDGSEKSVFSKVEHDYLSQAALRGDYATVIPIVEKKYLDWVAKNDPKRKVPKIQADREKAKNFSPSAGAGGKDSFATPEEYDAARKDPKYRNDGTYREEIERKRSNSNFGDYYSKKFFGSQVAAQAPRRD